MTKNSTALSRRSLLATALFGTASLTAAPAFSQATGRRVAGPLGQLGLDATQFGLRPGSPDDQSRQFQTALGEAAKRDAPLVIAPGRYRVSRILLPNGARLIGVPGATRFVAAQAGPLLVARGLGRVALSGLTLD
ncbi:MAG: TIGR03808 family TAT-translocated repetitive protein, partial [Hyphomicrobiales bacterium]